MARPTKRGLSYFPLDTDWLDNRKIQRLLCMYGCNGTSVFLSALCEIYTSGGYYMKLTEDVCFDIGFTLKLKESLVAEIIACCVTLRLFDRKLFEEKRILSSAGIQLRYIEVNKRYPKAMDPSLVLVEKTEVMVTETPVKVTKTPIKVTKTPVKVTKTPAKGKGKGNIKGNKKEKNVTKKKDDESKQNEYPFSGDNGESARRAELLRMAEAATTGC